MKIGVLSDTHLHQATRDFLDFCDQYLSDMDLILHAGDFVSAEIVKFLSQKNFHGVCGNMDPPDVEAMLPAKKEIDLGSYTLGLIHGWGSHEGLENRIRTEFQDVDVIVYGHSHRASNQMRDGVLLFNPGTAMAHHSRGNCTMGVLSLGDGISGRIVRIE